MNTETILLLAAVAAGFYYVNERAKAPRLIQRDDGSTRYQPHNPHSGVSGDFGVGYEMPGWLFGTPGDATREGGGEFGVVYRPSF